MEWTYGTDETQTAEVGLGDWSYRTPTEIPMTQSTTEANKELVHEYFDAWEDQDPAAATAVFAADFSTTYTDPTGDEVTLESEDLHDWIAGYLEPLSEYTHEIHEMVAEEDWVLTRITYSGIHDGVLLGVEPTGNRVEVQEHLSFRIDDGGIVEMHWTGDHLGLLRQLDVDLPIEK